MTHFKPTNTLQQLLVRPKDKVEKKKVVGPIYHITCDDCEARQKDHLILSSWNISRKTVLVVRFHNMCMWIGQNME